MELYNITEKNNISNGLEPHEFFYTWMTVAKLSFVKAQCM